LLDFDGLEEELLVRQLLGVWALNEDNVELEEDAKVKLLLVTGDFLLLDVEELSSLKLLDSQQKSIIVNILSVLLTE